MDNVHSEMKISIPSNRETENAKPPPVLSPTRAMEDEQHEELLSQAIIKRREWSEKYRISDAILFDLFSEFSSMMMIAKKGKKEPVFKYEIEKRLKEVLTTEYDRKMSQELKNG